MLKSNIFVLVLLNLMLIFSYTLLAQDKDTIVFYRQDLKIAGFENISGSFYDNNLFYKFGGRTGELDLIIDFEKIEVIKSNNKINARGNIRDYKDGSLIPGDIIFASISYQDSNEIHYKPRLIEETGNGYFDITADFDPNEIIIARFLSYTISYYNLSALIENCGNCGLENEFAFILWKLDSIDVVNPVEADSVQLGNFLKITKPHFVNFQIYIPSQDTLRINLLDKEGKMIGKPYSAYIEKGYYTINLNNGKLLNSGIYFLQYVFQSVNKITKFLLIN